MILGTLDVGHCVRAADGFASGGDAVVTRSCADASLLAVIDVLGHGPNAHQVAQRAEAFLENADHADAAALMAGLDAALAASLGATVGIATIRPESGEGAFVGIGNCVARLFGRTERRLVSADGVVGQSRTPARTIAFSLAVGETLVMHTDGITSRFTLLDYPNLLSEDPTTAARELVRRFGRSYDDAASIVARRTR